MAKDPFPFFKSSSRSFPFGDVDPDRVKTVCPDIFAPLTSDEFKFLAAFFARLKPGHYWLDKDLAPGEQKILEKLVSLGFIVRDRERGWLFVSNFGEMRLRHGS